jgi:tyrosinase
MVNRREFAIGATALLATPFILTSGLRSATPKVRRDVMDLPDSDPFFAKYAQAVEAMHADTAGRNWLTQAKIHADQCRHGGIQFLHWHRHYLVFFERICGVLIGDPDFALPYWNWTKNTGKMPDPFYDLPSLNVETWNDPGQYVGAMWGPVDTVAGRGLARGQGLQSDPIRGGSFTQQTINNIRNLTDAGLFRRRLEGSPHNDGHVVSGALPGATGHIGSGLSPLDPVFWLHHCMVDRLWAEWQSLGNVTPDPGASYTGFFDGDGSPVDTDTAAAMDTLPLGYTYDILTQAPRAQPGGDLLDLLSSDQLEQGMVEGQPAVVGAGATDETTIPEVETPIPVSVPGLASELQRIRVFRQSRGPENSGFGIEGRRLFANFSSVMAPEAPSDILVNVFVNCPYLSPNTPFNDPHYAGTFSFFGRMAGMDHGTEITIDVTEPVRTLFNEGRLEGDQFTVQLMAVPAVPGGESSAKFSAGEVSIVSA